VGYRNKRSYTDHPPSDPSIHRKMVFQSQPLESLGIEYRLMLLYILDQFFLS
jgi:hypothetical protein